MVASDSQAQVQKPTREELVLDTIEMLEKGEESEEYLDSISELKATDLHTGLAIEYIAEYWKKTEDNSFINGILPKTYSRDEGLCIVIMGFKLKEDGTPEEELIERLKVGLEAANEYPKAHVLVTGGGTAAGNKTATEAEVMADWLVENGLEADRLIIEKASLTTEENAIFSINILKQYFPKIKELVIVTTDYHIGLSSLMFEAKIALDYEDLENAPRVVGNVAYMQRVFRSYNRTSCANCLKRLYAGNTKE